MTFTECIWLRSTMVAITIDSFIAIVGALFLLPPADVVIAMGCAHLVTLVLTAALTPLCVQVRGEFRQDGGSNE